MASRLALFYRTLGQTLGGGLPLARALDLSTAPVRVRRHLAERLLGGSTWEEALAGAPPWIPRHHHPVLTAAASAGRLPETLALLAAEVERVYEARRRAWSAAAYPTAVLHFAALVLPAAELFTGTTALYVRSVAAVLVPLWSVIAVLILWIRTRPGSAFATGLWLPGVGSWLRHAQLSRLASLLAAQLLSGVPISEAWERAAAAVRWGRLSAACRSVAAKARAGRPPSESLEAENCFPRSFVEIYAAGEASGSLDDALGTLARLHGDAAGRALSAAALWYPQVLYLAVAAWVAHKVVTFYLGYVGQYERYFE